MSRYATIVFVSVCAAGVVAGAGSALSGSEPTSLACLALLVFGLPHGTLDLALMTGGDRRRRARTLVLYLGTALAMFGLWSIGPIAALIAFLTLSVVHFAEDWSKTGSRVLSCGMAVALLSAPAIFHRDALNTLFDELTATVSASVVEQLLFVAAPVAFALAAVALTALWQMGHRSVAIDGLATLAAMTFLPPVIGFALFFCLSHSPQHLAKGMQQLGGNRWPLWRDAIVPFSAASLAIAVLIFFAMPHAAMSSGVMSACFITLSVLTLPHMAVPMLLRATDRR